MIYDAGGNQLYNCYDAEATMLLNAYDAEGTMIYSVGSRPWDEEITIEKLYNSSASTYYYVVTVPQTRTDGTKQYPFVFVPNGSDGGTMSTLTMMQTYDFYMGMNGGYFDYAETRTYKPRIIAIENGVSIECQYLEWNANNNYILTIDDEGTLNYANPMASGTTAEELINNGIVSAIAGLVPLVIDGQASTVESSLWVSTDRAQRQIIGQKTNGDYVVITCEGRNFDNSSGFTGSEARTLCVNMGLKFAMMVDGGGSTETVIGDEQINTIYEGTTGRIVPTYIVFNGTDTFGIPNAS